MGVRAEDHGSALRHHLSRVLVNDREMRRNVDAAVFSRRGEAEDVVVLVDRPADRAERVVAVRQHVGDRERSQARCPRRLDDANVSDVMARQLVELDPEHIAAVFRRPVCCLLRVVRGQDLRRHRAAFRLPLRRRDARCRKLCRRFRAVCHEVPVSEIVRSLFLQ